MSANISEEMLSDSATQSLVDIKLVVFDVDGVLTDGKLYYSAEGETTKVFHVRDGVGLKLLVDNHIHVAVMTAKDSAMVRRRMSELGVELYFPGVKNKQKCLEELIEHLNIQANEVCFVGDDMVDIPAMTVSGFSICPNNAYIKVQQFVDIIAPIGGGEGVARYVCDLILEAKDQYEQAYKLSTTAHFERKR